MRDARSRHGSALIDVLLALALLAIAGTALVAVLGQTAHSMRSTLETERLTRRADEQLASLAIANRAQLAAISGRTVVRGWTIEVHAAASSIFEVSIAPSDTAAPILRTTFYRPDSSEEKK